MSRSAVRLGIENRAATGPINHPTSMPDIMKVGKAFVPREEVTVDSLCQSCTHVRRIVSGTGSIFWLCELAQSDKRFAKYPPQPVVRCVGFTAIGTTFDKPPHRDGQTPDTPER